MNSEALDLSRRSGHRWTGGDESDNSGGRYSQSQRTEYEVCCALSQSKSNLQKITHFELN